MCRIPQFSACKESPNFSHWWFSLRILTCINFPPISPNFSHASIDEFGKLECPDASTIFDLRPARRAKLTRANTANLGGLKPTSPQRFRGGEGTATLKINQPMVDTCGYPMGVHDNEWRVTQLTSGGGWWHDHFRSGGKLFMEACSMPQQVAESLNAVAKLHSGTQWRCLPSKAKEPNPLHASKIQEAWERHRTVKTCWNKEGIPGGDTRTENL